MKPVAQRTMIPVAEPHLGGRELEYVTEAMTSGWISSIGPFVARFEEELAAVAEARHALAVANGTVGLHLALAVLGVGPGDEVIVPAYTFVASAAAVHYVGATPVFADVDPGNWCLAASEVERLITPRTRAVMPVHMYGHPCDMDAMKEFGLAVVEDAAEALGARYKGAMAGALGDVGTFSFYGNKTITTGEGGAVLFNDDALADRGRVLRDHAMHPTRRYWHEEIGFNFRITNIQAAIGCAQLERVDELLARKRAIARRYREGLGDVPGLQLQVESPWAESSWWMFTLLVEPEFGIDRDALAAELRAAKVDSRPGFVALHELPHFAAGQNLPVSERIGALGLTLPSGTTLTDDDVDYVIESVRAACRA
jgi:perosamine synthetase